MQLAADSFAEFTYPLALMVARNTRQLQNPDKVTAAELVIVRFTVILALSLTPDGF